MSAVKEPVDHIIRPALPWRTGGATITECGLDAAQAKTITRAEYIQRKKDLGLQRCSLFTCMTCSQTADRWATWENDPRVAMQREIEWERGSAYWSERTDRGQLLKDELLALVALVAAHPDEFAATLHEQEARRQWIAKKESRGRHDA